MALVPDGLSERGPVDGGVVLCSDLFEQPSGSELLVGQARRVAEAWAAVQAEGGGERVDEPDA